MFKNLLLKHNAEIMDEEYGISVDLKVCVPFEESDRFLESVKNTFSAIVIPKSCGVYSRIS